MMRPLLAIALAILAASAQAADYAVQPGSRLGFSQSFQGERFEGQFDRFTASIAFDPRRLAGSRFDVSIALASVNTRNDERDEALRSADFFDAGRQAQARYVATRFRALGGNRFVAEGQLTLRGVTRPVALTFAWVPGAQPVLEGRASVSRLAFGVGAGGDWADTGLLPDAVQVTTRLLLAPRAAAATRKQAVEISLPGQSMDGRVANRSRK
jgi:polyisoprenoid-binding protein YceI